MVNPTGKAGLSRRSGDGSAVRAVGRSALPLSSSLAMALACLHSFSKKDAKGIRFRRDTLTNSSVGYSSGVEYVGGRKCCLHSWVSRTTTGLTTCGGTRSRTVSYTHLRAHETRHDLVCRLL